MTLCLISNKSLRILIREYLTEFLTKNGFDHIIKMEVAVASLNIRNGTLIFSASNEKIFLSYMDEFRVMPEEFKGGVLIEVIIGFGIKISVFSRIGETPPIR